MTTALKNKSLPQALRAATVAAAMLGGAQLPALAAPQWCNGTLSNLLVDDGGGVYVVPSWLGNFIRVCNVNANLGSITPATCMNWVSFMRSAAQRGAQTTIQYSDAPACASMPSYAAAPYPSYVLIAN